MEQTIQEQLQTIAEYAVWEKDTQLSAWFFKVDTTAGAAGHYLDFNDAEIGHPRAYAALMPVWVKLRAELSDEYVGERIAISDEAFGLFGRCGDALLWGTPSDFCAALASGIQWLNTVKNPQP